MAQGLAEPQRAEIVVAVHGGPALDVGDAVRTGHRIGHELGAAYPGRRAVVLLLSESAERAAAVPIDPRPPPPEVPLLPWSHPGQSALEATLRAGESFSAAATALVAVDSDAATGGACQLLGPVLDDGLDLACPSYATPRYEGVLGTGLLYPFTRALFGRRLRQPLAQEVAVSGRAVSHLLGEAWQADPAHAGDRLWLVYALLAGDFRVGQVWLGARPPRLGEGAGGDLSATLAQLVGELFHEARLHAASWQRVKGSRPTKTYGEPLLPQGEALPPQLGPMLAAFQLGHQELQRVWGSVLPPQTMLALKRLSREPEEHLALDDTLWARIVYDFAVGYHLALMDRTLLLRSMTPLYLGWAAGFVRALSGLAPAEVEPRTERLCHAFESSKPYLISRWRWPDRFNP